MKEILATMLISLMASFNAMAVYPEKPVTIIVPFSPGGPTDSIARALAPKLQEKFGGGLVFSQVTTFRILKPNSRVIYPYYTDNEFPCF